MIRAAWIFLTILGSLLGALLFIGDPTRWPAPEPVPYQSEAANPLPPGHSPAALSRLIREPQNTWSNLAFVVAGALLLASNRSRLARALGAPLLAVGVGSFLYHASASASLRQLDVGAMYWLFVLAFVYCLARAAPSAERALERHVITLTCAALVAALGLTLWRNLVLFGFKPLSLNVATSLTATTLILTLLNSLRRDARAPAFLEVAGIVALFALAVFLQVSDRPGRWLYRPGLPVQPHALWHVLAAAAFFWAIARLERSPPRTET